MKPHLFFSNLVKYVNRILGDSQGTQSQMTRSARRAKKALRRQQQAANLQKHLDSLSRKNLTKTLEEKLSNYHHDLEHDLKKHGASVVFINNLLDYIDELLDPIIIEKKNP